MKLNTKKTYTQKDGTIWEWKETPAVIQALENYYRIVAQNKNSSQSA